MEPWYRKCVKRELLIWILDANHMRKREVVKTKEKHCYMVDANKSVSKWREYACLSAFVA